MNNFKKYILIMGASTLIFAGTVVMAETADSPLPSQNAKAFLLNLQQKAQERAQAHKERVNEWRTEAVNKVRDVRENAQKRIDAIRDAKKRDAANKIINQLERINKNWTDHFARVLDHLDMVLQKIASRAQKAKDNGKDTSLVDAAIAAAEAKIVQARAAVATQAQKTYVLENSTAANDQGALMSQLREKFKALKDQLHTDLTTLRDGAMKEAKEAVKDAFKTLSSVLSVNE
jgi:hypothetical protein